MINRLYKYFILMVVCLPVIFNACGKPTIKHIKIQSVQMIFTENTNYERQNYIAKDFPHPLEFIKDKSINGVTTPNLGLFENYIFLTTLNGYLSIIPFNDIGNNHKTRLSKGTFAAPTLYREKLYIPMVEGSCGLQAYHIKTGHILWELRGHYSHSSPILINDLVYHIDQKGVILCLNSENGQKIWQADLNDIIYSNLIYSNDHLIAISQNGQIQIYDPSSGLVNLSENLDDFVYAQAIVVNQYLYIISYHGILYNLNLKSGKVNNLIDFNIKCYTSLSSDGQSLFIPLSDGTLICRNIENNEDVWSIQLKGPSSCPILVTNDHIIAATSQKFLYIIDKHNGQIIQTIETDGRMSAPPVFDDNNVIICYEYDKIALYSYAGEEKNVSVQE